MQIVRQIPFFRLMAELEPRAFKKPQKGLIRPGCFVWSQDSSSHPAPRPPPSLPTLPLPSQPQNRRLRLTDLRIQPPPPPPPPERKILEENSPISSLFSVIFTSHNIHYVIPITQKRREVTSSLISFFIVFNRFTVV